jgi:hypothetical protein
MNGAPTRRRLVREVALVAGLAAVGLAGCGSPFPECSGAISGAPAMAMVGESITLTANDQGGQDGSISVTHRWSATGGRLSSTATASTTFTCDATGPVTITLVVTNGSCQATASVTLVCSSIVTDAAARGDGASDRPGLETLGSEGGASIDEAAAGDAPVHDSQVSDLPIAPAPDARSEIDAPADLTAPPADVMSTGEDAVDAPASPPPDGAVMPDAAPPDLALPPDGGPPDQPAVPDVALPSDMTSPPPDQAMPVDLVMDTAGTGTPDAAAPDRSPASDAGTDAVAPEPWPGSATVVAVDAVNAFGGALAGISYEPLSLNGGVPSPLWAVQPDGTLFRLLFDGSAWAPDPTAVWSLAHTVDWLSGKSLRYPDGTGSPATIGVAVSTPGFNTAWTYVAAGRDNDAPGVSRLSVLRYGNIGPAPMSADPEWNLGADLGVSDPAISFEAITFLPFQYLEAHGFIDESTGAPYDVDAYPWHGNGLFALSLSDRGTIYFYVLALNLQTLEQSLQRVATVDSGLPHVTGLHFDRDTGALWTSCGSACDGAMSVLGIVDGHFAVRRRFARPAALPATTNGDITTVPEDRCSGGSKAFFWSDRNATDGHSLRQGSIPCGALF